MEIVPLTFKKANEFVKQYHRHNNPVWGYKFAIGLQANGELIGVAIAGRPVARLLDNGKNIEITRLCVKEGYPNACSKLYARMRQICQLMGYEKIITYTLTTESGASLRAIGAKAEAITQPKGWSNKKRKRVEQDIYYKKKIRWELNNKNQ